MHGMGVLKKLDEVLDSTTLDATVVAARIALLSTEFYHMVPHISRGLGKLPDISTKQLHKAKCSLLNEMLQMYATQEVLARTVTDSVDHQYASLGIELKEIGASDARMKMVEEYVQKTHGKTHNSYKLRVNSLLQV